MSAAALAPYIGLLAGLLAAQAAPAADLSPALALNVAGTRTIAPLQERATLVELAGAAASADTRRMADWVLGSGDNQGLPFVIVDKIEARVFAFDARGRLLGASPALLGLGRGDASTAGIGARKLIDIPPGERITPSGRFVSALGPDLGAKEVLWIDYDAAISLHRVFTGTPSEHRLARLASPSPLDNRISWGCINVPVTFYEAIVHPLFAGTRGIVYVLPETPSLAAAFPGLAAAKGSGAPDRR